MKIFSSKNNIALLRPAHMALLGAVMTIGLASGAQNLYAQTDPYVSTGAPTSSAQRAWEGESYNSATGMSDASREFMRQSYIRAGREVPDHLQTASDKAGGHDHDHSDTARRGIVDNSVKSNVRYRMARGDGKTLFGMPLPKRVFNNVPDGR